MREFRDTERAIAARGQPASRGLRLRRSMVTVEFSRGYTGATPMARHSGRPASLCPAICYLLPRNFMSDREAKPDDLYEFVTSEEDADFSTQIIHNGESPHASAFPIYQANTVEGTYVRMRNPTVEALEEKMRSLEGGAATVAMGSGMAAVSHTLLGLLAAGDRIVVHQSLFIGVRTLLNDYVAKLGIDVARVDLNSPDELARALEKPTRLVYFETVSNPDLAVVDAPKVMSTASQSGATVVVDNTLLTPYLFKPLAHGADAW